MEHSLKAEQSRCYLSVTTSPNFVVEEGVVEEDSVVGTEAAVRPAAGGVVGPAIAAEDTVEVDVVTMLPTIKDHSISLVYINA